MAWPQTCQSLRHNLPPARKDQYGGRVHIKKNGTLNPILIPSISCAISLTLTFAPVFAVVNTKEILKSILKMYIALIKILEKHGYLDSGHLIAA